MLALAALAVAANLAPLRFQPPLRNNPPLPPSSLLLSPQITAAPRVRKEVPGASLPQSAHTSQSQESPISPRLHHHRNKVCIAVGSSTQQPTSLRTYSGNRRLNPHCDLLIPVIEVLLIPISRVAPRREQVRPALSQNPLPHVRTASQFTFRSSDKTSHRSNG